jgi:hypothetical protein
VQINSKHRETYEFGSRPLDELSNNLTSDPSEGISLSNCNILLDRISLGWTGDDRRRGRGLVLYERH